METVNGQDSLLKRMAVQLAEAISAHNSVDGSSRPELAEVFLEAYAEAKTARLKGLIGACFGALSQSDAQAYLPGYNEEEGAEFLEELRKAMQ